MTRNPTRSCIACRHKDEPKSFIRLARAENGDVARWTGHGRGAYICRNESCVREAFKKGRLERALKGALSNESKDVLLEDLICELR